MSFDDIRDLFALVFGPLLERLWKTHARDQKTSAERGPEDNAGVSTSGLASERSPAGSVPQPVTPARWTLRGCIQVGGPGGVGGIVGFLASVALVSYVDLGLISPLGKPNAAYLLSCLPLAILVGAGFGPIGYLAGRIIDQRPRLEGQGPTPAPMLGSLVSGTLATFVGNVLFVGFSAML